MRARREALQEQVGVALVVPFLDQVRVRDREKRAGPSTGAHGAAAAGDGAVPYLGLPSMAGFAEPPQPPLGAGTQHLKFEARVSFAVSLGEYVRVVTEFLVLVT